MQGDRPLDNLVLVSFMGTGKASVGRMAAAQLGCDFMDTDDWIETHAGQSIPQLFATSGEEEFRRWERHAARPRHGA